MTTRLLLGVAALAFPVTPGRAQAQSTSVSGRVYISGDSTRPVVGAEVALLPGLRTTRSDSSGAFRFADVSPGSYTLRARRVGFDVAQADVAVARNEERRASIALRVAPQVLSEVVIAGHRVLFPAKYAEAYGRMARGNGFFFTRERIDSLFAYDLQSVLTQVPGVRATGRGVYVARCATGAVLGSVPHIQVYVDGVRLTDYTNPLFVRDVNQALATVPLQTVQLVEVYLGNRIPAEFMSDACAVVVVWTR